MMQSDVCVALAQIPSVSLAPETNLEVVLEAIRSAASQGASLVVLPELCNVGQVPQYDAAFATQYFGCAEPLEGDFVVQVCEAAATHGVITILGIAERHPTIDQVLFNSGVVISAMGRVIGVQRKLHLPGEERHYFARGTTVAVLDTEVGRLSVAICYDLYIPEVPRVAALRGSEMLIGIANLPYRQAWPQRLTHISSVRAYENMQHVVVVNRVGVNHGVQYGGGSVAAAPPGVIVARSPECQAEVSVVTLSADALVAERCRRPVFGDRRPELYGEIVEPVDPGTGS